MSPEPRPKKLLEQVDDAIRLIHYSPRTEETYIRWIKHCILTPYTHVLYGGGLAVRSLLD